MAMIDRPTFAHPVTSYEDANYRQSLFLRRIAEALVGKMVVFDNPTTMCYEVRVGNFGMRIRYEDLANNNFDRLEVMEPASEARSNAGVAAPPPERSEVMDYFESVVSTGMGQVRVGNAVEKPVAPKQVSLADLFPYRVKCDIGKVKKNEPKD